MARSGNKQPAIDQAEHIGPDDTNDNIEAKRVAVYEALDGVSWSRSGTKLAVQLDTTNDPILYLGKAPIGSATSAAVWQVAKLDTTSGLAKTWANGDASFSNIYDNRASLSYS